MTMFDMAQLQSVGWRGFLDFPYLLEAFGALVLATALGVLIAFHPSTRRTVDTVIEAELPKVYVVYAVIGAMVGVIVLKYGTRDTGRLIIVTLLGLISGLNLPHFAVLAGLFSWVLIWFFDRHLVCRLRVRKLAPDKVREAANCYGAALAELGCEVIREGRWFKERSIM